MAEATFSPAPKPEGVVTIVLSESEARQFTGYKPYWKSDTASGSMKDYGFMRDHLQDIVKSALKRD